MANANPSTLPVVAKSLTIYNSLSRRKEPFETIAPGQVRMYVCGVTPYDRAHIGHAMSLIVFDVIRRYLEFLGYQVMHAQNFTDIDDKIIERADREGITPDLLTERLIAEWHVETAGLNAQPAHIYPRATQEMAEIIAMIERLMEQGHAYPVEGDVYYRVRSFPGYGKLSHRSLDDLLAGARIQVDERKDDPLDFALWKAAKPGEPSWASPWGPGRPGWHIECSAMCSHHLDGTVDIHGGGADLIFPHHENEIAQSEAFLEREPFARFWVHNGLLRLGGEKMSKSLGNFVPVRDILGQGLGPAFRLMVLQSHYRAPLTYTEEALAAADRGLDRLRVAVSEGPSTIPLGHDDEQRDRAPGLHERIVDVEDRFHVAMRDDFNTPGAIAALFDLARAINREEGTAPAEVVSLARTTLTALASLLGLELSQRAPAEPDDASPFIDLLLAIRGELRVTKHWQLSDKIRDELARLEITIEDTATGTTWAKAKRA